MDGEIWDEDRWEAFLKEHDRRIDRYMTLLFRFMTDNPPVGTEGSDARKAWEDDLREYFISNGISPDEVFPRMPSEMWTDDNEDDLLFFEAEQSYLEAEERDDELHDVRNVPIYREAHQLSGRVLRWSNELPGRVKDSTLVQFCAHITQIPTNIAKGHGIGLELEMIGGNIACAKRALASANAALELLRELRASGYMHADLYRSLYEETFELRNQTGIYVQELRRRFDLGIE